MYSNKIIDHYKKPRNIGCLPLKNKYILTGISGSLKCGDIMKLQMYVNKLGIIKQTKFKTYGCGSAIASSSLTTELIKSKTIKQILYFKNILIKNELSLPLIKIHCSILAEDAIKSAIYNYKI